MLHEVQLCGVVALHGVRSTPAGRQLLLLAVLLVRGDRGIRRDELVEILWPDAPPRDPGKALNPLLSRLRRVAGEVEGRGVVRLAGATEVRLDVAQAAVEVQEAESLVTGDPARAGALAAHAAARLEGEFLPAFSDPWTLAERERLTTLRAEALTLVARAGLARGGAALDEAEQAAAALVAQAPLQERAVGLLMEVLAARGEEAAALEVYEQMRLRLRDELGGVPGRRLREAHAELLHAGAPGADASALLPLPVAVARSRVTAMTGREAERARIAGALGRAPAAALVVLHGPGAIGKTRLAAEVAADRHRAGSVVLFARPDDQPSAAFAPLVGALRPLVTHLDSDGLADALGPLAGDLATLLPALHRRLPALPTPAEADADTRRFRLFEAVAALVAGADRGAGVLLVVDDAHRLDRSSAGLLAHLVRTAAPSGGLSVLATTRAWPVAVLDGVAVPAGATEDGLLALALDALELPGLPPAERANPGTVARVLDRLDIATRTVVDTLALDGGAARPEVLAHACARAPAEIEALLARAADAGVLDDGGAMHDAVRESTVAALGKERRGALHARLAVAYEGGHPDPEPVLSELATHWAATGSRAGAARAASYGERAARRALGLLAYEQAATHARLARDQHAAAGGDPEGRLALLLLEGDARNRASALGEAREVLAEALTLARELGRDDLAATAALGHGGHRIGGSLGDPVLVAALELGLAAAPETRPALRARVAGRLAASLAGDPGGRRTALADEALALARAAGNREVLAETLLYRHATLVHRGRPGERLALLGEADALARAGGHIELALHGRMLRFGDLLEAGRPADARAEAVAWEQEARAARVPYHRWAERIGRPTLDLLDGRIDDARAGVTEAAALAAGLGDDPVVVSAQGAMGFSIAFAAGDAETPAAQIATVLGEHEGAAAWHAALAWCRALAGDAEAARAEVRRVVARDLATVVDMNRMSALSFVATAAVVAGAPDEQLAALHAALLVHRGIWAVQLYGSAVHGPVAVRLALLDIALGRLDAAQAHLDAAAASVGPDPAAALRADLDHAVVRLARARDGLAEARAVAAPALRHAEAHGLGGQLRLLGLALAPPA